MIFIVVKWKPKAEYVENFTDEVAEFTQATRSEPGNLFFERSLRCGRPVGNTSRGRVP